MERPSSLEQVLARHAARNFGQSGFREVTLTVISNDEAAFSYRICHIWQRDHAQCTSLYFLAEPQIMAGTSVLLVERPHVAAPDIWLRLRTAKQPIRIDPYRAEQFVLGTDFTYQDLRFWLPTNALHCNSFELAGEPLQCTIAARQVRQTEANDMTLVLDGNSWLPLRIEWTKGSGIPPWRIYSATGLVTLGGIDTPRVISVCRPIEQYKSTMVLRKARYDVIIKPDFFQIEHMSTLSTPAFDEWRADAHVFPDECT